MDKDKKEKIREKFNEVTEKVYDSANIKGSLDNMYSVVDKIRTIALTSLCIIILIMTIISLYTVFIMPKDITIGDKQGVEYNNIIAKISTIDMKEEDINNFIDSVSSATKTKQSSISDEPTNVDKYFIISLNHKDSKNNNSKFYIYKSKKYSDDKYVYLEQPYRGIFRIKKEKLKDINWLND